MKISATSRSEKFWDKIAQNYDKTEKKFEQNHHLTIEFTKKFLKDQDNVLDYGCGTGTKTYELSGHVKKITGVDISSKMIDIAKARIGNLQKENISFVHSTIFDDRFIKESFDVILAFNIFHTLINQQQTIQRMKELLKPNGLLISATPCLKEKMEFSNRLLLNAALVFVRLRIFPNILTRFKYFELEEIFKKANFQIIESKKLRYVMSSCFIVATKN